MVGGRKVLFRNGKRFTSFYHLLLTWLSLEDFYWIKILTVEIKLFFITAIKIIFTPLNEVGAVDI